MNLTWPNVEDGHMWGYITVFLIIMLLLIGFWLESRLDEEEECISCGEEVYETCLMSRKACGHHCNHTWSHDACCWCRQIF